MTREEAKERIAGLVERFRQNEDVYKSDSYNETRVRVEFIDHFFHALGWDVHNEKGYAEQYKDVVHEDTVKVGGFLRAPDYSFRIGGQRKFFLEAKKPAVNIKDDTNPAYQLRRYAWSAKLPLSILTDFEELSVYDCRIQPGEKDRVSVGRVAYYSYDEYLEKFDEIYGRFSREAVLKGSFDRYVESAKLKKGTAEVDSAFLRLIEAWRDELARNIAIRNKGLDIDELNFAVQHTIDRIIFLRICEDRGIEDYGRLQTMLNGANIYSRLLAHFYDADDKYNSGLFDFRADRLSESLRIDDRALKNIIEDLYPPKSPYEFSVIGADILGNVYEQFLGKVIRLTAGHQAKVEEKPEVKKAGGVFYTPGYIVDYIVKETLGRALEGKTPAQASKIRVLDPACGSGSFLIGAYQYLLDWHTEWYANNDPEKHAKGRTPAIFQGKGGWRLSTGERKRILLNNVFGVDIDRQAVEVTKLSLLLKVLEGENQETIGKVRLLFHERALPDLEDNIKCGNSLIGPDFYSQMELLDGGDARRINVFDWHDDKRGFGRIMKEGGFDVVIGNPPWGADFSTPEQKYLRLNYRVAGSNLDSYIIFMEGALKRLHKGGLLGYITPDTFLRKDDHQKIRELLLKETEVKELIETGPVFSKVRDTWCLVTILSKITPKTTSSIVHKKISRFTVSAESRLEKFGKKLWDIETESLQSVWQNRPKMKIGYLASKIEQKIISKIEANPTLGQLKDKFRISRGEEGSKYALEQKLDGDFYILIPQNIKRHAIEEGIKIAKRELTSNKVESFYKHPKIWITRIQKMRWKQRLVSSLDFRVNSAGMKTLQVVISTTDNTNELKYLQGILSSSLINFWCVNYLADDMNQSYIEKIPICTMDNTQTRLSIKIVSQVELMLDLNSKLQKAKTPHDRELIERRISATDRQIDSLVYELYGLTPDEIAIVEQGA